MGSVEVDRQPYPSDCFVCRPEDDKENHQHAWHGLRKQVKMTQTILHYSGLPSR